MYAPSTWAPGSSYSHLDYSTFNNTANQLMVYAFSAGEAAHDPGPVTKGLLKDLGWRQREHGTLSQLVAADLNGDGRDDLAGINSAGQIYYTTDLTSWYWIPGTLSQLVAADLNGDGRGDLAGINSAAQIYYTTDLTSWYWLSKTAAGAL
jgi:hypothetical protein